MHIVSLLHMPGACRHNYCNLMALCLFFETVVDPVHLTAVCVCFCSNFITECLGRHHKIALWCELELDMI